MFLQALWLNQNEPENWKKAKTICEKQDFINYRLSNNLCCSSTNCAARWNWNVEKACKEYSGNYYTEKYSEKSVELKKKLKTEKTDKKERRNNEQEIEIEIEIEKEEQGEKDFVSLYPGRPVSLLEKINLTDLLDKWPSHCVPMGGCVGKLTQGK